jgi:hypothetical protein
MDMARRAHNGDRGHAPAPSIGHSMTLILGDDREMCLFTIGTPNRTTTLRHGTGEKRLPKQKTTSSGAHKLQD